MSPPWSIEELDVHDTATATALVAVQRAAYAVEAELIGFHGIPQLHETVADLRAARERFLGLHDTEGLAGAVGWQRLPDDTVEICRLVVAPRAFRRGYATALLDALDEREPATRTLVSTGSRNTPALALYRGRGFRPVRVTEVAPGVSITELERVRPRHRADPISATGHPR